MILTLTPNPSIDRAMTVERLDVGEVLRASDSRVDPGGKGVNVSRALAAHGTATVAVLPAGGPPGRMLENLLDHAGVPRRSVPIEGWTRINITLMEPGGATTKINEPGPRLTPAEVDALTEALVAARSGDGSGSPARWVVGCGSLPPGAPPRLYADLVERARVAGLQTAVDTSGEPLALVAAARPALLKPNHDELGELVGRRLRTLGEVVDAAQGLVSDGVGTVVASLGRHGAVAVEDAGTWWARATVTDALSTVGAGDRKSVV